MTSTRLTKAEMAELLPAVLLLWQQVAEEKRELQAFIEGEDPSLVRDAVEAYLYKEGGAAERLERLGGMVTKLRARQEAVGS